MALSARRRTHRRPVAAGAPRSPMARDVIAHLTRYPKTLPPKYFYDAVGARLFEQICELPEYYLTRTELEILQGSVAEIAQAIGPHAALIEYGSGAGAKARLLLDTLDQPAAYVPVDISRDQLSRLAAARRREYPALAVHPVHADFTRPFALPEFAASRRIGFFPGSTIGNFHAHEAAAFLRDSRNTLGPNCGMVLGVDRRKDPAILHAAYNDPAGVTAAFNRNLLARLNRELHANFAPETFRHDARFNDRASRIEMFLESTADQLVHVAAVTIPFARGERILTECSYKYDEARLAEILTPAGFVIRARFTDAREWFWVLYLEATR